MLTSLHTFLFSNAGQIVLLALSAAFVVGYVSLLVLHSLFHFSVRIHLPKRTVERKPSLYWPELRKPERVGKIQDILRKNRILLPIPLKTCVVIAIALSALFFAVDLLYFGVWLLILAGLVAFTIKKIEDHKTLLQKQFPAALEIMHSSLKSGFTFPQAVEAVAREAQKPVAFIFQALARAENYRIESHIAMDYIGEQISLNEWQMFADALKIQARVGGDIIPTISEIKRTVSERIEVEQEVKTATASGKLSGIVVSALVPIGVLLFNLFAPEYIAPMFSTLPGQAMLVLAIILEIAGAAWIWKLTKIDF